MTREEIIKALNEIKECPIGLKAWYIVALEMAIKTLSQDPCDDAISRNAVLDIVCGAYEKDGWGESNFYKAIKELSPVTQKSGKWRPVYQGDEIINYRCSECEFGNTFGKSTYRMHYCPNCGAKMESEVKNDTRSSNRQIQ